MEETNFQRIQRQYPKNGFVLFATKMGDSEFRKANGPSISLIIPGNFSELIRSAKLLGFAFSEGDVKEILIQINEADLKKKKLPEKSIKFLCDWINKCK